MNFDVHAAALVLAMAFFTWLLRFLPFHVSGKHAWVYRLSGKSASVGNHRNAGCLLPEGCGILGCSFRTAGAHRRCERGVLQRWKRNSLISILVGTIFYMVLIRTVF